MARYAIYYAPPPDSPLGRFGQQWVGRDAWSGDEVVQPHMDGFDLAAATAFPRRYGFHATLKAPFELATAASENGLVEAVATFARSQPAATAPPLQLTALGGFLALVPSAPCPAVDALAASCVRHFEPFRAPITAEDRERRLNAGLSERQCRHLDAWGYPYVFDDFSFHMTLTGPLAATDRDILMPALRRLTAPLCQLPFAVDWLVVSKQAMRDEPFRIVAAHRLEQA